MKFAFVIHRRPSYAPSWTNLVSKDDPETHLILISNEDCINQISAADKNKFFKIIQTKEFNFDSIKPEMDTLLSEHFKLGDETRLGAISEFDVSVAASLRDHFREKFNAIGPGFEVIDNFRNKLKMKEILGPKGVRLPKYHAFDSALYNQNPLDYMETLENSLGFPMFAKPIDGAASIDTTFIKDKIALHAWCVKASSSQQKYEIDEFIHSNDLFHCDSIVLNGKIVFTFVCRYLYPNADARSGKPLASMVLSPESEAYPQLKQFAENALMQFPNLPDGMTHQEIFKDKEGCIFLEIGARPSGCYGPDSQGIYAGTLADCKDPEVDAMPAGLDLRLLHLRQHLGLSIDKEITHLQDPSKRGPFAAMHQVVMPEKPGIVAELRELKLNSKFKTEWHCKVGDLISPNKSIMDNINTTMFWNLDYAEFEKDFESLKNQNTFIMTPEPSVSDKPSSLFYNEPADLLLAVNGNQPPAGLSFSLSCNGLEGE